MKIISNINEATYIIEIEGAIVGIYAEELDRFIHSINFTRLGTNNLVFDLTRANMIDSIGLEVIHQAQERGLKVSILNPQGAVKDMLDIWSRLTGRLSPARTAVRSGGPFVRIVEKTVGHKEELTYNPAETG